MTAFPVPKVVVVIDPDRVVINHGSESGVKQGQRFLVYALAQEVTDPDTGISLGTLEIVRGTGKVTHLQEKMATLTSDRVVQRRIRTRNSILGFGESDEVRTDELSFDDPKVGDLAKPI